MGFLARKGVGGNRMKSRVENGCRRTKARGLLLKGGAGNEKRRRP